jgi:hypothetical protein
MTNAQAREALELMGLSSVLPVLEVRAWSGSVGQLCSCLMV